LDTGSTDETMVSLYYLNQVAENLRAHQVSVKQWLGAENLKESALYDSRCLVEFSTYCRLIESAIQLSKLPHLGLIVGAQLSINHHGALGFALLNCGTIREMLAFFNRYLVTRTPLFKLQVVRGERATEVFLDSFVVTHEVLRPLTEVLISTLVSTVQSVSSRVVNAAPNSVIYGSVVREINFSYSRPDYFDKYQQLLNCRLKFARTRTSILFSNDLVDKQLRAVDQNSLLQAKQFCEQELSLVSAHASWRSKVLMQIISRPDEYPDINIIASAMNVSARTLHRNLCKEGTHFKKIVEQSLSSLAQQYLQEKSSTIKFVAYRLGYSDVANFRRAFKRWTGMTPQDYMQQPTTKGKN